MNFQDKQHFSHQHILIALNLDKGEKIACNACENPITETEPFHGCCSCNYYLHDKCLDVPRSLQHASHPFHPLTLHPNPTYPSKSFSCNACGSRGNAFSFSCAHCEFDLHIHCAKLPAKILIDKHPHELNLLFVSPYKDPNVAFMCDECHGIANRYNWVYYCAHCDFGMHSNCTTVNVTRKEEANRSQIGYQEYLNDSVTRQIEEIKALNDAQERLAVATLEAKINARSRKAILEMYDSD